MSMYLNDRPDNTGDSHSVNEPEIVDQHLVDKIKAQALIDAGMTRVDQDGQTIADPKKLQFEVLQAMQAKHVANGKKDLAAQAVTKFELFAETLPDAPGVRSLARGLEERVAQADLMRDVWTYTNTGTSGFVQKNLNGPGLILCEAKVSRTKLNEETKRKEPTTELARFLTADRDLIMTCYTGPAGAAFYRAARKLEAQLGMVSDRRPELAAPVARQLGVVVRQAIGAVPHADIKQVQALTSLPSDNETDAD